VHRQALECDVSGADQKHIFSQATVCTYAAMLSNRQTGNVEAVLAPHSAATSVTRFDRPTSPTLASGDDLDRAAAH
jgi:hypothetical protein